MPEAACAALCLPELLDGLPHDLFMTGDDELCDALPVLYLEGLGREVDQCDLDLPAVVRVYRPWAIQDGKPVLDSQPTTGTHLRLVALRQFDE